MDFVVGDSAAIEVKATGSVTRRDLSGLRRLAEETPLAHRIVVCREPAARVVDGIRILPVMEFLRALWTASSSRSEVPGAKAGRSRDRPDASFST